MQWSGIFHGAITKGLKGKNWLTLNMASLVLGFSDDGRGTGRELMKRPGRSKELDKDLAHCEDESLNNQPTP